MVESVQGSRTAELQLCGWVRTAGKDGRAGGKGRGSGQKQGQDFLRYRPDYKGGLGICKVSGCLLLLALGMYIRGAGFGYVPFK